MILYSILSIVFWSGNCDADGELSYQVSLEGQEETVSVNSFNNIVRDAAASNCPVVCLN